MPGVVITMHTSSDFVEKFHPHIHGIVHVAEKTKIVCNFSPFLFNITADEKGNFLSSIIS